MRVFAGPNGSGKSSVKAELAPEMFGVYLNPDDIEREVRVQGYFDLRGLSLPVSQDEVDQR